MVQFTFMGAIITIYSELWVNNHHFINIIDYFKCVLQCFYQIINTFHQDIGPHHHQILLLQPIFHHQQSLFAEAFTSGVLLAY